MERIEANAEDAATPSGRAALKLAIGSALCLVAAGLLLWWREGGDVFTHLVTSALAWCF